MSQLQRGYILHHRPYQESSMIINLLIDGIGRVDAITRVGSGKRSNKSILQPFQPLLLQFSAKSASHSLKTISHIEAATSAIPLSGNALFSGFYLNELLVRLISGDHQAEALFVAYHQTLLAMASSFCSSHLRYFEKVLLQELGALPSLKRDVMGEAILKDCHYRLQADNGFMPVDHINDGSMHHLRSVLSGQMLIELDNNQLTDPHLNSAKGLMRLLLNPLLGNKPLLSRKLFIKSS